MWLRAERLSETGVAFARVHLYGIETAIAFAGEKWAFWVRFSVAEVMVVSTVAVWGRALVMAVSCWPTSAVAEVSLVSTPPPHSSLCAKKFALLGLMVGLSAKKFAQRTKNGPQSAVCGVLGEVFRENTAGVVALGELCLGVPRKESRQACSVAPPLRYARCWAAVIGLRVKMCVRNRGFSRIDL